MIVLLPLATLFRNICSTGDHLILLSRIFEYIEPGTGTLCVPKINPGGHKEKSPREEHSAKK